MLFMVILQKTIQRIRLFNVGKRQKTWFFAS